MTNPAIDIPNLLYRYALHFDDGDWLAAARLFDRGCVISAGNRVAGADQIVAMWRTWVKLYDGKPHTRHLVTNPIITLTPDGQNATCLSQWTVVQARAAYPLQIVASGRYQDELAVIDDCWCFIERTYLQVDFVGDTSVHLIRELAKDQS